MSKESRKKKAENDKSLRIENYENHRKGLLEDGYIEKIGTISIIKANLMSFATAGPLAVVAVVLFFLKHKPFSFDISFGALCLFFLLFIVSIPVHELIHGAVWGIFCKNKYKSIHLGIMWEQLTPYCHSKEPLSFWRYLAGGLAPLVILGAGTFIAAYFSGSVMLLCLSIFNILSAGGDTTIAIMLLKYKNAVLLDHPYECGFVAFLKP